LNVPDSVDSGHHHGLVVRKTKLFKERILRKELVEMTFVTWCEETYPENHSAKYNATSGRHASEERNKILLHALLIRHIAATDLHIDTLSSKILNSLPSRFSLNTTARDQDKVLGSLLWQPTGNVETNAAGPTDDDI
jgi:hypothetical protein